MVHSQPFARLLVILKERELRNPEQIVLSLGNKVKLLCNRLTQSALLLLVSAITRSTSPVLSSAFSVMPFISSSLINFAKDDDIPSSVILIKARPFAPLPFAISVSLSISLRVRIEAAFSAFMALTEPPFSRAPLKTTNSVFLTISLKSISSMP